MTGEGPAPGRRCVRVVLAPDVIGGVWLDPDCAVIMGHWSEGRLLPIVNRSLLLRYVRLWHALGLSTTQVRRWSWWFTASSTALYLPDVPEERNTGTGIDCCVQLAELSDADCIVHRGVLVPPAGRRWVTTAQFALEMPG